MTPEPAFFIVIAIIALCWILGNGGIGSIPQRNGRRLSDLFDTRPEKSAGQVMTDPEGPRGDPERPIYEFLSDERAADDSPRQVPMRPRPELWRELFRKAVNHEN